MKSLRWTAAAAALAAAGLSGRAEAFPSSAYTSSLMPYNRATCLARAAQAMAAQGWATRPSGGPAGQIGLLGHKEPSSAYILCPEASNALLPPGAPAAGGTNVVIFVASTSPNVQLPADEAAQLQDRMVQPAR